MFHKLMLLTYGLSRTGKNSFINTISQDKVTPVCPSNNESATLSVNPFEVNLTDLPRNPTSLTILDVPEKYDSRVRMTNAEIKAKIEETVLSISDLDSLSGVLIFEALPNQPTQLRSTLMDVKDMLGPEFRKSAIVVLTKADKIKDPEELAGAKRTAEEICRQNNLPFIYLQNNHNTFILDDSQYNEQFDSLIDKIKSLSPYILKEVQHYQKKIKERAEHLKLTLPKRRKTVPFEYETQEILTEEVPVKKSRVVYEVHRKRRGGIAGLFGPPKLSISGSHMEYYVENETRCRMVTVTKTINKEIEEEHDDSCYLDMAKKDQLEEIRSKLRGNEAISKRYSSCSCQKAC